MRYSEERVVFALGEAADEQGELHRVIVAPHARLAARDLAAFWKDISITKKSNFVVEFVLPEPFAPFPSFATVGLIPFHLLRDIPVRSLSEAEFNSHPVGTGPYRLMDAFVIRPGGVLRHREWGLYEVGLGGPDNLLVRVGWPSDLARVR